MPDGNGAVLTREFVPQEFLEKPYLKDFLDKPWDKTTSAELFKKLDGAESLLGRRPAVPDPKTAKPEELEKFFEQFRPEKAEEYEVPLEKDAKVDPNFIKALQAGLHAGRISKVQAAALLKSVTEYGTGVRAAATQAAARKAAEFDTLAKTYLGEQNKAAMESIRGLIKQYAPPAAQASLDKLTDEQVVVMGATIQAIHKKYAPADELNGKPGAGSGTGGGPSTVESKRTEMYKLIGEKSYSNAWHAEHATVTARVAQLAKEIDELENPKK